MTPVRTININITIEGDYYADNDGVNEWARRFMARILDLSMASVITTMDYTITE